MTPLERIAGTGVLTILLSSLLAAAGAASTPSASSETPVGLRILRMGADYWPALGDLEPDRSAFVPPYGGSFRPLGVGVHFAYLHRAGGWHGASVYAGGEFTGYLNGSDRRFAGTVAGTGEPVRATLYGNAGYFAPCGRLVWTREKTAWYASAGAGLYLLRIKDQIEGVGIVETDVHDATFGGYLGVGSSRRIRRGPFWLDLEARVHAFDFRHLRPGFRDQPVGGPMFELAGGMLWAR